MDIKISELPEATQVDGDEFVPIVQNGVTKKAPVIKITQSPSQTQPFLTLNQQPTLTNSRYLSASNGLKTMDGGAQGALSIVPDGVLRDLVSSADGFAVKSGAGTLVSRSINSEGAGIEVKNQNGVDGNPVVSLTGMAKSLAQSNGFGFFTALGETGSTIRTLNGEANQIELTNADGRLGGPVISIASNPRIPGNGGVIIPIGSTGSRLSSVGSFRFNTDTNSFEGYTPSGWGSFSNSASGVTSVNVSGGSSGLAFSGGPITSAGTISISGGSLAVLYGGTGATTAGGARTSLLAAKSGSNADITALTGITGGISTTDFIDFDRSANAGQTEGRIRWNQSTGTLAIGLSGLSIEANVCQQMLAYVTNADSVTIQKGQAVYISGATGNRASVKRASNLSESTSAGTLGIATQSIAASGTGFVTTQGFLSGLDTSGFAEGDSLYVGSAAGSITNIEPAAPNHLVYIGVVERANAGSGQIYIKPQEGYSLGQIHDVYIENPIDGQAIVYDGETGLWKNSSVGAGTF
jgi:hypothetical protein